MRESWWVRHAPVARMGCYLGHSDVEAVLPDYSVYIPAQSVCFSSPLKRCVQTARWLGAEPRLAEALKEQHFGAWEGRSYDEVWAEERHRHDWSRPESVRPEGGESFADLCLRVEGWIEAQGEEPAVIVAHAGVIRAGARHALKLSYAQALALQIDFASVTCIAYQDGCATARYINRPLLPIVPFR